jgi:hypothetical protein
MELHTLSTCIEIAPILAQTLNCCDNVGYLLREVNSQTPEQRRELTSALISFFGKEKELHPRAAVWHGTEFVINKPENFYLCKYLMHCFCSLRFESKGGTCPERAC